MGMEQDHQMLSFSGFRNCFFCSFLTAYLFAWGFATGWDLEHKVFAIAKLSSM